MAMTDRQLLEAINNQIGTINNRLDSMDNQFGTINDRLDSMDHQFGTINDRLDSMDNQFGSINDRLGASNDRIESMDNQIKSMNNQIGQLVSHVAEVRRTNVKLEAEMHAMRDDIRALDTKVEVKVDFLASKIDHFVDHFSVGQTRDRNLFEEERHLRSHAQTKTEQRLDDIEQRLEHLEASSS